MKKANIKTSKGITLLALIITIIVLLILATVTIKLIVDNGVIGRAKGATSRYTQEQEKELINLAYADYKMEKAENGTATLTVEGATVSGDEYSGWTITFAKTGNRYKFVPSQGQPELKPKTEDEEFLEKYLLGEDKKGIDLFTILDPEKLMFTDSSVEFVNVNDDNTQTMNMYLRYKEKGYKLVSEDLSSVVGSAIVPKFMTQSVELVYEQKGREGQTVKYSIDGTPENEKDWTVLYDYGDTVEIISPDAMGNLTLGYDDEEAQTPGDVDKDGNVNTQLDKTIYSYNNAINRLNKYCNNLVTNSNKISVRSVGSNPNNPNAEGGMHKSEALSSWHEGRYNGLGKKTDYNYKQDCLRICFLENGAVSSEYWLASRNVIDDVFYIRYIGTRYIGGDLELCGGHLWRVYADYGYNHSSAVRPVVKVNKADVGL